MNIRFLLIQTLYKLCSSRAYQELRLQLYNKIRAIGVGNPDELLENLYNLSQTGEDAKPEWGLEWGPIDDSPEM